MIFVWRYQRVYHGTAYWHPVGWFENEKGLAGLEPGAYALHEGSESAVESEGEVQAALPTQLTYLGTWDVQTPEGMPDDTPIPGVKMMFRKRSKKGTK